MYNYCSYWLGRLVGSTSKLPSLPQGGTLAMVLHHSLTSLQFSLKLSIDKNRIIFTESECFFFLLLLLRLLVATTFAPLSHGVDHVANSRKDRRGSQWRRNSGLVVLSVVVTGHKLLECQLDFQVHVFVVHQVVGVTFFVIILLEGDGGLSF